MTTQTITREHLLDLLSRVTDTSIADLTDTGQGAGVYTGAEWAERGEDYGSDALFVLVHDGGPLAPYCNWDYCAYRAMDDLRDALAAEGVYAEQCTSWYSAIYPIHPEPEMIVRSPEPATLGLAAAVFAVNDAALDGRISRDEHAKALCGIGVALEVLHLSWDDLDAVKGA
jgi:hypothetical protein